MIYSCNQSIRSDHHIISDMNRHNIKNCHIIVCKKIEKSGTDTKTLAEQIIDYMGDHSDIVTLKDIECSVVDSTMPGTHELFMGKVEAIHVDEEYLDANGNILWDKMDLM